MLAEIIEPEVKEFLKSVDTDEGWLRGTGETEMSRESLLQNFIYHLEQKRLITPTDELKSRPR